MGLLSFSMCVPLRSCVYPKSLVRVIRSGKSFSEMPKRTLDWFTQVGLLATEWHQSPDFTGKQDLSSSSPYISQLPTENGDFSEVEKRREYGRKR